MYIIFNFIPVFEEVLSGLVFRISKTVVVANVRIAVD